jgi:hypothetical protein
VTLLVGRVGGTGEVQVILPFAGGGDEAIRAGGVTLQDAEVSEDGTTLTLMGQVSNSGGQPLLVNEKVTFRCGERYGASDALHQPGLPMGRAPRTERSPSPYPSSARRAAEAVFTLLNNPFQLTGLR